MNMKRLLSLVAFFATVHASAQQVNPVPDYVFANRMSAGRNTVTDTAAYFSIGPRYGATRGMMPPMVVDTASFSANKRNGLLIFSVQKNKFLYWDSVGVKWAEMAGTGGSAITGSGVSGYMPEFTTTTNLDTTRLYHSAGRFAIGSTTTTNGVFNVYGGRSYFDTSLLVGTNTLFADEANARVGVGLTSMSEKFEVAGNGIFGRGNNSAYYVELGTGRTNNGAAYLDLIGDATYTDFGLRLVRNDGGANASSSLAHRGTGPLNIYAYNQAPIVFTQDSAEVGRWSNGEFLINTTDLGSYRLQVGGNIYTTTGAAFAVSSGSVGIGTANPDAKLNVIGAFQIGNGFNFNNAFTINRNVSSLNTAFVIRDSSNLDDIYSLNVNSTTGEVRHGADDDNNTGFHTFYVANSEGMRLSAAKELLINTTTDAGDYKLQVSGNLYNTGSITTGAPSGGSIKPWKIGEAATVSPTSPNRTIRVEIDGTVYYIHAKTTND